MAGTNLYNAEEEPNPLTQPPAVKATQGPEQNQFYGGAPAGGTDQYANGQPAPAPAANSADPFASIGGGVQTANGGWVPKGHPDAQGAGQQPAAGGNTYGQPASGQVPPPTQYTTTPDMQQLERQSIIDQIKGSQQPTSVNDANIKAQLDPFAAAQERTRRTAENEAAERAAAQGMGSSGSLDIDRRMAQENAGLATANKGAELVGKEITAKRDELSNYLKLNASMIDADQARMIQKQIADMDADIRRRGLDVQTQLGNRDLDVRNDLGQKGLQNDAMRMLLQNRQFGDDLGFRIGSTEAQLNRDAIMQALGG